MRMIFIALLCISVMPAWITPADAAESYDNCTGFITTLPTVITTQGTWCLTQDLATAITTGNGITINADNVTLDCNDFTLDGTAAGSGTLTNGIWAQGSSNVTVRHCKIRGFAQGLVSTGGPGLLVEDNRFDNNRVDGIDDESGGVIRRNRIFNTGSSTFAIHAYGIYASTSTDILNNTVSGVAAEAGGGGNAMGIHTYLNLYGSVSGNRVRGLHADGAGAATAIDNQGSGQFHFAMRNNSVVGDDSVGSKGLACSSTNGRAKDNLINGFATGISLCGDAGKNDITP